MSTYQRPAIDAALAQNISNTIRFLSADGVQAAKSGHPGMPMGCADIAAVLLTRFMRWDPKDLSWFNRDRFALSAGHGSMLLYSMLYLGGILPLEELKNFRQLGSKTPGHPEYGDVPGVDVTTGPLASGFATGVGLTLAEAMLAERYHEGDHTPVDHYTYVIMGDGCQMEGLSNEAASFAGHMQLGKLIAFYDDNEISIEGSTNLAFTENVNQRYDALGWHVQDIDGHNHDAIAAAIVAAQADPRPSMIVCHTTIGQGAPNKAGTASSHGEPLGEEEIIAAKAKIGWSSETFHVPADVLAYRDEILPAAFAQERAAWDERYVAYQAACPAKASELARIIEGKLPENWEDATPDFAPGDSVATRSSGGAVMNAFGKAIPELVGGSADLAPSTKTEIKEEPWPNFAGPGHYANRNLHFGVREHAMGFVVNGLALHGFVPFGATFMVFHDYMRSAVRLSALQGLGCIWVYTHDSFYVGEDGPTHQPIEHLAAMRSIPRLHVMRPGDANEAAYAWRHAIARRNGPTAMAMTRQNLPTLDRAELGCACQTLRGGYVLRDADNAEMILVATGSELSLAMEAADALTAKGRAVRVVSMPCLDLFQEQPAEYQASVLPKSIANRVVIEAGIRMGWEGIMYSAGGKGLFLGREDFGSSGPMKVLAEKYGFTPNAVVENIEKAGL
jgi:transketolase